MKITTFFDLDWDSQDRKKENYARRDRWRDKFGDAHRPNSNIKISNLISVGLDRKNTIGSWFLFFVIIFALYLTWHHWLYFAIAIIGSIILFLFLGIFTDYFGESSNVDFWASSDPDLNIIKIGSSYGSFDRTYMFPLDSLEAIRLGYDNSDNEFYIKFEFKTLDEIYQTSDAAVHISRSDIIDFISNFEILMHGGKFYPVSIHGRDILTPNQNGSTWLQHIASWIFILAIAGLYFFPRLDGPDIRTARINLFLKQFPPAMDILAQRHPIQIGLIRALMENYDKNDSFRNGLVDIGRQILQTDDNDSTWKCYLQYYVMQLDKQNVQKKIADRLEKQLPFN